MADYHLQLRTEGSPEPACELIDAVDDDEARGLAELRLLMTRGAVGVTVLRSGMEILRLLRDGPGTGDPVPTSRAFDDMSDRREPSR